MLGMHKYNKGERRMKIFLKVKISKPVRRLEYFNLVKVETISYEESDRKVYTNDAHESKHMLCGSDERIVGFIFETNEDEIYDDKLIFTFKTNMHKCKIKKILDCNVTDKKLITYDINLKRISIEYEDNI